MPGEREQGEWADWTGQVKKARPPQGFYWRGTDLIESEKSLTDRGKKDSAGCSRLGELLKILGLGSLMLKEGLRAKRG